MPKDLSAKYYQDNEERLQKNQKKLMKDIKIFVKKENMVVSNTKIYQEKRNCLNIGNNIT